MVNNLVKSLAATLVLLVSGWVCMNYLSVDGWAGFTTAPNWLRYACMVALWSGAVWGSLFVLCCFGRLRPVATDSRLEPTPPEAYQEAGLGALPADTDPADLYLDVIKRTVTNLIYEDVPLFYYGADKSPQLARKFDFHRRVLGEDAPTRSLTMVGVRRLEHLQACIETLVTEGIPGDLIETGSFLGGATIYMRAVLRARQIKDRRVYACDTFVSPAPKVPLLAKPVIAALASIPGIKWQRALFQFLQRLPNKHQAFPTAPNPSDDWVKFTLWALRHPAVIEGGSPNSLDLVRSHFARFGLLDEQIVFLQGFFSDTLARPPFQQLALIRLDGDTYESTMDAIVPLYDLLSPGGFCIVDDYHSFDDCRRAIDEFRTEKKITEPIVAIDNLGVFWRKAAVEDSPAPTNV